MKMRMMIAAVVIAFIHATGFARENDPCGNIDLDWLRTHSPIPSGQIVSKQNMDPLCEIVLKIGNEYVPLFAGDDFIIAGEMLKHRTHVTRKRIDALKADNFAELIPRLDAVAAIVYLPAENKGRTLYLITDPLCGYCSTAAEKIVPLAETYGVAVKAVLYSVHGQEGDNKSIEAVCRDFSLDQYTENKWKSRPFDERHRCERGEERVKAAKEVIGKAGIGGVPVFIFDDGRFVNGANMTAVEKILQGMD
jgi:thiol:disulfide interchange protein DsbC